MTTKTTIYWHPSSQTHDTGPGHPERIARADALMELLASDEFKDIPQKQAPAATREQLLAAHPESYIQSIEEALPESGYAGIDGDTILSPGSLEAALHSAGAACAGIDDLLNNNTQRVFCALRPPGHHAESTKSMGFCLFANIFIATRHAQEKYGIQKIAIVDFDVHHGNGTDSLVRTHDHDRHGEILFISSHQFPLWPMSGVPEDNEDHVLNYTLPPESGSSEMRTSYEQNIIPALEEFKPDLLLISAGFDAHADDPLANLNWSEEDFQWITEKLCSVADRHADGRILSVLEGGYDINALTNSVRAHILALNS